MLNNERKEFFRNVLLAKLDELMAQTRDITGNLSDLTEVSAEFMEQASITSHLDFSIHIRERETRLIYKIDHALEKLEEGTFGICEACGESISEERLEARPVTTLCIGCKRRQEAQERLRGG